MVRAGAGPGAGAVSNAEIPPPAPPSDEPAPPTRVLAPRESPALALVRLYRDGRQDEAVAALENTSERERAAELEALRRVNALPDAAPAT